MQKPHPTQKLQLIQLPSLRTGRKLSSYVLYLAWTSGHCFDVAQLALEDAYVFHITYIQSWTTQMYKLK